MTDHEQKLIQTRELIKKGFTLEMIHEELNKLFGSSLSNSDIKQCRLEVNPAPFDEKELKPLFRDAFALLAELRKYLAEGKPLTLAEFNHFSADLHVDWSRMQIADILCKIMIEVMPLYTHPDFKDHPQNLEHLIQGLRDSGSGWMYSFDELPPNSKLRQMAEKAPKLNQP